MLLYRLCEFQSRKRFRHCWSARQRNMLLGYFSRFNRESDSVTVGAAADCLPCNFHIMVSIAKAIPSLLEPCDSVARSRWIALVSIAKAIPSLLERKARKLSRWTTMFQSRKRFRHCWSGVPVWLVEVQIRFQSRKRFRHCWSLY